MLRDQQDIAKVFSWILVRKCGSFQAKGLRIFFLHSCIGNDPCPSYGQMLHINPGVEYYPVVYLARSYHNLLTVNFG